MARVVKTAEQRRLEIIQTAEMLFKEKGYSKTSVDMIIKEIGVAKGTFYYYFKSKNDVLGAIVEHTLADIVAMATQVANEPSIDALTKMKLLLSNGRMGSSETQDIAAHLHLADNRELHELSNIQTVLQLSPVLAKVVEQGIEEQVFTVSRPLATVQFLLTGSQFLLDEGYFSFSQEEQKERRLVMQTVIEKALGAASGSFDFMNP